MQAVVLQKLQKEFTSGCLKTSPDPDKVPPDMKKKDHLALAVRLAELAGDLIPADCVLPFLIGSVEPDLNPFSYLRGMRRGKKFHGHNAANCTPFIRRSLFRLMSHGLDGALAWFRLGVLMHYVADTFTSPHNDFMDISIKDHVAYEAVLHLHLEEVLSQRIEAPSGLPYSLFSHLTGSWKDYQKLDRHDVRSDVEYIMANCMTLLFWAFQHSPSARHLSLAVSL